MDKLGLQENWILSCKVGPRGFRKIDHYWDEQFT